MKRSPLARRRRKPQPCDDPKYLKWIRLQPCVVCSQTYVANEAAHVGPRGLGQKCPDRSAIPLCPSHHRTGKDAHHGGSGDSMGSTGIGLYRGWSVGIEPGDNQDGMATIQDIAAAIAQMEGANKSGSLAQRNNNPGNLRFARQPGATQGAGGYAAFPSADAGMQALQDQITLDASRGLTLSQFISKYAPSSENDTSNYLSFVSSQTGIQPGDVLASVLDFGAASDSSADLSTDNGGDGETGFASVSLVAGLAIGAVVWLVARAVA